MAPPTNGSTTHGSHANSSHPKPVRALLQLGVIIAAITGVGAGAATIARSFGWVGQTTGERLTAHETQMKANRDYTDLVKRELQDEQQWLRTLVEASATAQCLDAEASPAKRRKLAEGGMPCQQLYDQRGLRP